MKTPLCVILCLFSLSSFSQRAQRPTRTVVQPATRPSFSAWRVVSGETNNIGDYGWEYFSGTVIKVQTNGVVFRGKFGDYDGGLFLVMNFPRQIAIGEQISSSQLALPRARFMYFKTNALGPYRVLDYGIPCQQPGIKNGTK